MAYSNRKIAYTDAAFPELQPVTTRRLEQKQLQSRQKKHISKAQYYLYLGVNLALVFGLAQCLRALISDSVNLSLLMGSQTSVQQYYSQTTHENQMLSDKIRIYSSPSGIEELARNYLNMVGQNELPIRFQ